MYGTSKVKFNRSSHVGKIKDRSSELEQGLGRLKFWIYTKCQHKKLFKSLVTNLSLIKLLKRVAESSKDRRLVPIEAIASEASEHEIEVLFMEALLEFNNVFKEAPQDRPIDDVKAEAKKACLETFMKCSRSKNGNPNAFKRYLNQIFENFKQKDTILKGLTNHSKV